MTELKRSFRAVGIIPARYGSRRYPGKLLVSLQGRSVLEWVYRRAETAETLDDLLVATDDKRIQEAVFAFGGKAVLTSPRHRTGTERVAAASRKIKAEVVVNIQGDEPFIRGVMIDQLVEELLEEPQLVAVTLATRIKRHAELTDPNTVKTVMDREGFAFYFSRSPIPYHQSGSKVKSYKHIGLYGYRKSFLSILSALPRGELEKLEKLEQLRILENGYKIKVLKTKWDTIGIDTPADLKKARELLSS
jgi:3-deoxy-manno-octulosonate cytidylyltransferase (CMP-KDO synthetase)